MVRLDVAAVDADRARKLLAANLVDSRLPYNPAMLSMLGSVTATITPVVAQARALSASNCALEQVAAVVELQGRCKKLGRWLRRRHS